MEKKNIWFLHHYASLPNLNGYIRPYCFSKCLKDEYNCYIFASSYQHFSGDNLIKEKKLFIENNEFDTPFIFVNTSAYDSALKRIKNIYQYYSRVIKVGKIIAKKVGKPDIIIASSPHLFALSAGIKLAKFFNCKCISEVRDLWPEAIFNSSSRIKEKSLIGQKLKNIEYNIYKKSDGIIFTKEGDIDYIYENKYSIEQGGNVDTKKCYYINNGIDLPLFNLQTSQYQIKDEDLDSNKKLIIYTGTVRPTNNVDLILDTAKEINDNNILFLIYGDGNQLPRIKQRIIDEKIENVKVKGFIERKYLPYILSKSYINLLNYSDTKYNWKRGNSSNKLFEYMASGKPIIATMKTGYSLIDKYKCGIEIENVTPVKLANSIISITTLDKDNYCLLCENSKEAAKNFDYSELSNKLRGIIINLLIKK